MALREGEGAIDCRETRCKELEVRDSDGSVVLFHKTLGLFQLDEKQRLKTQKGSVRNLYAYGANSLTVEQSGRGCEEDWGDCALGFEDCEIV